MKRSEVNAGKTKRMVFAGEEVLECEVCVDGIQLEHVSEFNICDVFWRIRYRWGRVS